MKEVGIQRPSKRTLAKMKKGESVQLKGGKDMVLLLHDSRPIKKSFMSGKGMRVSLSPDEVIRNTGKGFWDDARKAFSPVEKAFAPVVKKVAPVVQKVVETATPVSTEVMKRAKPVAKKVAKIAKPIAEKVGMELANKALDYAPELGADALSALAVATGQPELIPVAQIVGREGGKELGKFVRGKINKPASAPAPAEESALQPTPAVKKIRGQRKLLPAESAQQSPMDMEEYITSLPVGKLEELLAKARVKQGIPQMDYSGSRSLSKYADAVPQAMYGEGIKKRGSRRGSNMCVGMGAKIINPMPQALQSQPYSENYQFRYTLPPDLVSRYAVERMVEDGNAPLSNRGIY